MGILAFDIEMKSKIYACDAVKYLIFAGNNKVL